MHTVVETRSFMAAASDAGMTADEVAAVVTRLAADPEAGKVMPGTGGARKIRVAGRSKGKSGGYRVITFYTAPDVPVFLLDCYGKGDKANLTKEERNELRVVLGTLVEHYRAGLSATAKAKEG